MDTTETPKSEAVTATVVSAATREIIDLPNGIQVYMLDEAELEGREYFEFLRISRKAGAEEGIQHLIFQCFRHVDTGKPLQPEEVLDAGGIGFKGVADLSEHILKLFPAAQVKQT